MNEQVRILSVNDRKYQVAVADNATVLWTVRNSLGLTGTKCGCDMGTCGCCTVLIDGRPRLGCLTLAAQCEGSEITTIEGLARDRKPGGSSALTVLQQAFHETGAEQCGFCTPGFIMTSTALLERNPDPSEPQIREAISGNMCRCTGYVKIIEAVQQAADRLRERRRDEPEMAARQGA